MNAGVASAFIDVVDGRLRSKTSSQHAQAVLTPLTRSSRGSMGEKVSFQ
eukprot:CAMPEP_0181215924 /NCGR_PEP_ID=MMETSP1096-20121128/26287_1 /TAXON_ID=156174 ORGANISM="Chrysochromulina ericina, Strain CCMP281" /NCGR_SAMPLE_ID=MMETSP1096 /ASSEMBLY_ACC=CAM_ASM_000453 /LENGTH=48 /DNA_ID= /DNA_START= /DNA_END= /DNA_ORIENTATION=